MHIADPAVAKSILANTDGRFREHSDFFWTGHGIVCTRDEQLAIGRALRDVLGAHVRTTAHTWPRLVDDRLAGATRWPDTANRLMFDVFGDVLLGARPSPELRAAVTAVVDRAVLAGARDRQRRLARLRLRARTRRAVGAELRRRRACAGAVDGSAAADVFDALVTAAPSATDEELTEVYLACLFAVVGSLGFVLAWSVHLLAAHLPRRDRGADGDPGDVRAEWVVREALRLWPVAWLFGRTSAVRHHIGGIPVEPGREVLVCGWLVHRDPREWPEPDEFRPERWRTGMPRGAFVPFGWGSHACTGAGLSLDVAARLLRHVTEGHHLDVTTTGTSPQLAAALAPPVCTVRRRPVPLPQERR